MRFFLLKNYQNFARRIAKADFTHRFYCLKLPNRFFISLLLPKFVLFEGHKIYLDPVDALGLLKRDKRRFLTEFVHKIIKKGDIVIDIGAFIGDYTLIFAKIVGEEGRVFAFEPDPENFSLLKKNIRVNNINNVIAIPMAVGNRTGKIRLYKCVRAGTQHKIFYFKNDRKYIEIDSISLDDYFQGDQNIDLIKIDIEGVESAALNGMINILKTNLKLKLIIEFNPYALKESGFEVRDLLNPLTQLGCKFYNINEKKRKLESSDMNKLISEYSLENGLYTNLFCIREDFDLDTKNLS